MSLYQVVNNKSGEGFHLKITLWLNFRTICNLIITKKTACWVAWHVHQDILNNWHGFATAKVTGIWDITVKVYKQYVYEISWIYLMSLKSTIIASLETLASCVSYLWGTTQSWYKISGLYSAPLEARKFTIFTRPPIQAYGVRCP